MTRSKELVDSYYKLGMGISYQNVLLLRDSDLGRLLMENQALV